MCVRILAEQASRERDKVKADLDHADQRNLQLVSEVDDRHASMENLNQSRIRSDSHVCTWQLVSIYFYKSSPFLTLGSRVSGYVVSCFLSKVNQNNNNNLININHQEQVSYWLSHQVGHISVLPPSWELRWWFWSSVMQILIYKPLKHYLYKGGTVVDVCSVIDRDLEQEFRDRLTAVRSQVEQESDILLQQVERERGALQEELWLLQAQEAALQEELHATAQVSSPSCILCMTSCVSF